MTDLQQASKVLQGAPFHLPASEWELRQLSNLQLQQVLLDIAGRVCSLYKATMLNPGDDSLELLVLFLKAIKYPSPDHRLMLETEPKETMLGVLGWMASTEGSRPGLLEKRAFVGYHLTLPQLPPAVVEEDAEAAALLADAVSREATTRADALQAVSDRGNLLGLLDQAQAELQGLQAAVQQHLPQEQTVRIRRLEALHAMLSLDTVSEADVRWQQQAAAQLEEDIQAILLRRQSEEEAVGSSQAGQLRQAAQFMAAAVSKRRSETEQALRGQQQKLAKLQQEAVASQAQLEQRQSQGSAPSRPQQLSTVLQALDLVIRTLRPDGEENMPASRRASADLQGGRPSLAGLLQDSHRERLRSALISIISLQAELQAARQMSGLAQADSDGPAEDDDTATAIQLLEARDAELSTELDGLECRWDLLHNPTELAALRTRLEEQVMELSATAVALRAERARVQTASQQQVFKATQEGQLQPTPPPAGAPAGTKRPGTVRVFSTPTGKVMQL
ncbi:hypothetical protein WJX84_005292 [Apatococcus fuscideae]|uniref:IFT81 calponin homology domain-containing protein n=1 Tax=Apatococcus fuscideae TaxID=2026836 RepID=A0AAW1SP57_9CHLO